MSIEPGKVLIVGDFNVHWDKQDPPETKEIQSLLASYNLQQYVMDATHKEGHILDWVVSRKSDDLVSN